MGRKIMFLVEFLFQFVNIIFAWFALGNFFLVFQILTTSLGQAELLGRPGKIISVAVE
jgi:chitin synthase